MFSLLDHQLCTLRNALGQMSGWQQSQCSPQLVRGAESAVQGISILVLLIDEKLQALRTDASGSLTFHGKVAFLWGHSDLKEYLNQLNGQIMALSVWLHAYMW